MNFNMELKTYKILGLCLLIVTALAMIIYEKDLNTKKWTKANNVQLSSQSVAQENGKARMITVLSYKLANGGGSRSFMEERLEIKRRSRNKKFNFGVRVRSKEPKAKSRHKGKHIDGARKREHRGPEQSGGRSKQNVCQAWKYDTQDWTLYYNGSKEEYESVKCPKPTTRRVVKRIAFRDGASINVGCNNNTEACREGPFYDFKSEQRINTPPCCRSHLLSMCMHVSEELQRLNVNHSMISGGVIGWVRSKKMVPYDRDLDLIVDVNFWNSTEFWHIFKKLQNRYGYVVDLVEAFKLKLYFSGRNKNNIDVWAYWHSDNTVSIAYHGFKEQHASTMLPFKKGLFEWFYTYIPAKPVEYLDKQYGREVWRPEKQCMVRNEEGDCW